MKVNAMRIPHWNPELKAQPQDLVDAIKARRGGQLTRLDEALLWSEPLARGWNVYLKAVRTELAVSRKLRELAICTVALLTGAEYEYFHHAPDFLKAGGSPEQLEALQNHLKKDPRAVATVADFSAQEMVVIQYAAFMTLDVKVPSDVAQSMQQHFDTTELVELTSSIATYNMVARFLVALGVSPEN